MKKIIGSCLLLAAVVLGGNAQATIVSTAPTWGASVFIAAPPTGHTTVLKALQVSNSSANNACAYLYSSSTIDSSAVNLKLTVCAPAGQTVYWPAGVAALSASGGGIQSAAASFFGELFKFTGLVSINTGAVDSAKLVSNVTASYEYRRP